MSDKRQVKFYVDEDLAEAMERFVIENHGSKKGNWSDFAENAFREYIDNDRYARVESKLDEVLARLPDEPAGHTHTEFSPSNQASESVQKARAIADRIYSNHAPVVKEADLERAIEDIAGGHKDTLAKYKDLLRKRGLLWEHPDDHSPVWATERDQWIQWVEDYLDGVPSASLVDLVENYPVDTDEFATLAEAEVSGR